MGFCLKLSFFLLLLWSNYISLEAQDMCSDYGYSCYGSEYSHLYLKLEEALITQHPRMLKTLRVGFISKNDLFVRITLNVTVTNGTEGCNHCCRFSSNCNQAFCPVSDMSESSWILCDEQIYLIYFTPTVEVEQQFIPWMSCLHGGLTFTFIVLDYYLWGFYDYHLRGFYDMDITLTIDRLDCNPSLQMMKCVLSELISWIEVYSEVGGMPQFWHQHQKGTVLFIDSNFQPPEDIKFMQRPVDPDTFVKLCMTEYVFVSLSLALVIAKFFPAIHSQLVSRATSLESQSLYWGTAVVSNVFVYGLLFTAARGLAILMQVLDNPLTNYSLSSRFVIIPSIQEVIIHGILFIGAVITSMQSHSVTDVPKLPKGIARCIINISFCFTCFCCCVCCSGRCRVKTLQVLVLFSFMTFIYHCIMEAISVGFILFDDESRTMTVTVIMLCISLILFVMVFISFSLFLLSRERNVEMYQQALNSCGGIFMLIIVFVAVMLLIVMYMIVFFSLNLTGFRGIVTGLIPSIALSAATWYIKKRLKTDLRRPAITTDRETTGGAVNDGAMSTSWDTDPERQLLP